LKEEGSAEENQVRRWEALVPDARTAFPDTLESCGRFPFRKIAASQFVKQPEIAAKIKIAAQRLHTISEGTTARVDSVY
jgi:hypothetical protein